VSKRGYAVSVNNIRNNFSTLFEFGIRDHVRYYLKYKLNTCDHDFAKSKSTIAKLVTDLKFITPSFGFQHQADAVYFGLNGAFKSFSTHCFSINIALLNFLLPMLRCSAVT
jgi:hypothetical protein